MFAAAVTSRTSLAIGVVALLACHGGRDPLPEGKELRDRVETPSGLAYEVVHTGTGPRAQAGKMALIHEVATLGDGTTIADSWAMNHPVRFLLGGRQAIYGVDEAVRGMRVGERRRLVVPPVLSRRSSYPEDGLFGPDDTLYYDIVLLQLTEPETVEPGNED